MNTTLLLLKMSKLYIHVPFEEKDQAKALGARWDPQQRQWYVPEGIDSDLFSNWLPKTPATIKHSVNVRSPYYYIAQNIRCCWSCSKFTRVYTFWLPEGFTCLTEISDEEPSYVYGFADSKEKDLYIETLNVIGWERWEAQEHRSPVSNVLYMSDAVAERMASFTPLYKITYSKTKEFAYYMNHCEHCGEKQGDFPMHQEYGGSFFPDYETEASKILLFKINELFDVTGDTSWRSEDLFYSMKLVKYL